MNNFQYKCFRQIVFSVVSSDNHYYRFRYGSNVFSYETSEYFTADERSGNKRNLILVLFNPSYSNSYYND